MSWTITPGMITPLATGGNTVSDVFIDGRLYRVHQFTATGNSSLVVTRSGDFEYLVIGGGGAGGGGDYGGGGGAGGFRTNVGGSPLSLSVGTYDVIVGLGGAGTGNAATLQALPGNLSKFHTVEAAGGGYGGRYYVVINEAGGSGGSGGGGGSNTGTGGSGNTPNTSPSQGSNGGNGTSSRGGGGGGAAGVGSNGGVGGAGRSSLITGTSTVFAKGGDGATTNNAISGANNTGNGGDGKGGSGGSGIVIVRYAIA